jgi:hypothetical protein
LHPGLEQIFAFACSLHPGLEQIFAFACSLHPGLEQIFAFACSLHPGLDSPTTLRALSLPGCIPGLDRTFALAQVSTLRPQHFALAARSLPSRSREQRNEHVCTSAAAEDTRSVRRIDVNKQNSWWQKKLKNPGRRKKETRKKEGSRKKKKKKKKKR